jgi:spermidine synthase
MSEWWTEAGTEGLQIRLAVDRVLHRGRTPYQEVAVLDTALFGRVLVLDGVFQTSERDEHLYHEMLVHVPLFAHRDPRRVLIIGGGDGGALREVLRHPVERAVMVEIDAEVVALSREWLPSLGAGAFDDPRTELVHSDGQRYVEECAESFDAIIVDSTDPWPPGPGSGLFTEAFYRHCRRLLGEDGILVAQQGIELTHPEAVAAAQRGLAAVFEAASGYRVTVPLYTGGPLTIGWGSADPSRRSVDETTLERRLAAASFSPRHYRPAIHRAAFAWPSLG